MDVMISTIKPFGSINRSIVKGVTKTPLNNHYLIDTACNTYLISEDTFNTLICEKIPLIETKRKGVY